MSKPAEKIIDFDDRAQKAEFLRKAGVLVGKWVLSFRPHKPRRSLKANAFYHAAIVPAFRDFMRNHGQYFEKEEVHEFFLAKFASRDVVDPATGEVLAVVGRRSSKMDSAQFATFVDHCAAWMFDRFGIVIPSPELCAA